MSRFGWVKYKYNIQHKNAKKSDAIQTRNGWVKKGGKEGEIWASAQKVEQKGKQPIYPPCSAASIYVNIVREQKGPPLILKNDLPSNRYRVVRDMNSPRVEQKVKTANLSPLLCLNLHTLWRRGTFLLPNKHDLLNRQTELSEIWTRQKPSIKRNRPSIFLPALLEFIIQNWTKKIELWLSPQSFCKSFIHCICISILA